MYGSSNGTKIRRRCREVAVSLIWKLSVDEGKGRVLCTLVPKDCEKTDIILT